MDVLNRPAHEFGNDETVETLWAMKAMDHVIVYFNILCSVDPKFLKMCPQDEIIYHCFRQEFPDMDVKVLDENSLKGYTGKCRWREFCERFKHIEDYSFGTLIRLDCTLDYSPENTILVPRVQFYAIESARNKEGLNDCIRKKYANVSDVASNENVNPIENN